eukprot:894603-Amphidinium_carterae.1
MVDELGLEMDEDELEDLLKDAGSGADDRYGAQLKMSLRDGALVSSNLWQENATDKHSFLCAVASQT